MLRPFFGVSREQIEKYVCYEKIPFSEDRTNSDLSYERNLLRSQMVPKIAKLYPKYLAEFVGQMSAELEHFTRRKSAYDIKYIGEAEGKYSAEVSCSDFLSDEEIREILKSLQLKIRPKVEGGLLEKRAAIPKVFNSWRLEKNFKGKAVLGPQQLSYWLLYCQRKKTGFRFFFKYDGPDKAKLC